ncbi:XIAP-associated factor 1 isoform X2 [Eublepharis macularius]|uniref:XIAP-associated factor 1 isoform X2 n=1 Tax=Eublepharis macularius TaxID=481883 RepID=A0AA97LLM2_EUBMA|nr:XIAP-associated factor 1 isoform X2 [Eublepharis macularius]
MSFVSTPAEYCRNESERGAESRDGGGETAVQELVRCKLCHQFVQQYLLEHHEAEECTERPTQCQFCELDLPYHKLQAHLDTCGSRTTSCWHCGKYIMYKALKEHKVTCQARDRDRGHDSSANLCHHCHRLFPDERFLQHLNECNPLPQLLGALTTHSPTDSDPPLASRLPPSPTSPASSEVKEQDTRPKKKELSSIGRPSLKPLRSKKPAFVATLASATPQALEDSLYDTLVTCSQCNILLPSPTLQKHEKKCRRQSSLQVLRRSPRLMGKGEESA